MPHYPQNNLDLRIWFSSLKKSNIHPFDIVSPPTHSKISLSCPHITSATHTLTETIHVPPSVNQFLNYSEEQ